MKVYEFQNLYESPLVVDALYRGGLAGNAGDDPISKLVGTGNQGGFRILGSASGVIKLCVLYSSLTEDDWPDRLDFETGRFVYFGDNRTPGHELHDTRRKGNVVLKRLFDWLHSGNRASIPPIFVFTKGVEGRDVVFRGLAIPGAAGYSSQEDLVAVWKTVGGNRFQNYRAVFTVVDKDVISRSWLDSLKKSPADHSLAPKAWLDWRRGKDVKHLSAPRARSYRTKDEQLPASKSDKRLLDRLIRYFKEHERREYAFEECASELVRISMPQVDTIDLTRPWRDGGRDALGTYRVGIPSTSIEVEFALEAKCKLTTSGSGVKEIARLISRLRYRQFGIFVTTSYLAAQAYQEVVEDKHPVVVVSGYDLVRILKEHDLNTIKKLEVWLHSNFPGSG